MKSVVKWFALNLALWESSLGVACGGKGARNKAGPVLLMDFCLFLIFIFLGCSFQPEIDQFTIGRIGKELRVGIQMDWSHIFL